MGTEFHCQGVNLVCFIDQFVCVCFFCGVGGISTGLQVWCISLQFAPWNYDTKCLGNTVTNYYDFKTVMGLHSMFVNITHTHVPMIPSCPDTELLSNTTTLSKGQPLWKVYPSTSNDCQVSRTTVPGDPTITH